MGDQATKDWPIGKVQFDSGRITDEGAKDYTLFQWVGKERTAQMRVYDDKSADVLSWCRVCDAPGVPHKIHLFDIPKYFVEMGEYCKGLRHAGLPCKPEVGEDV